MTPYTKILCLLADDGSAAAVLERAAGLAEDNQAPLTVVGLVEPLPAEGLPATGLSRDTLIARLTEAESRRLDTLTRAWQGRVRIESRVLVGQPFPELARLAIAGGHDLLIKALEPTPGLFGRIKGSGDMHLLRKCPCAIWLVHPGRPAGYRRVLAAVDLGDLGPGPDLAAHGALNLRIAASAARVAIAQLAELHLVHAWTAIGVGVMRSTLFNTPETEIRAYVEAMHTRHAAAMDQLLHALEQHLGQEAMRYLKPRVHLLEGDPREVIPALAAELTPDLTVMGTLARTGMRGLLIGNTAETLLHQLDGSVLCLKPEGFVSPLATDS